MAGFGGIGNISPLTAAILTQPLQAVALRPGQVLNGIVQSIEPQTLLRFGNVVVPVERIEGLLAGQPVSAEVFQGNAGLQLRLTHVGTGFSQATPSALASSAAQDFSALIVNALRTLGKLELADSAVHLLSPQVARNATAVRLVLSLLLDRDSHSDDASRVAQLVQQAVDEGILTQDEAEPTLRVLGHLISDKPEMLPAMRHSAAASQQTLASRLAEAVAHGGADTLIGSLEEDIAVVLHRLRDNERFGEFLRQTGQHSDFSRAVERVLERFTAAQLVNARSLDLPYVFFEIPMQSAGPICHAHIHVMGDGGGKGHKLDAKSATVVFDLSTTALGELWITLSTSRGACSCWIRAQSIDTVAAIHRRSADLTKQLAGVGFSGATVHTTLWDGDRVQELATMMRRFGGINLQA
ncbi:MAG TPA: hypothetical protein PK869_12930 [Candidatus Hydrogenedentes bacterium]|nr:hypothetical protein [Candidatus Hydrogenedentota bacterium]